MQDQSPFPLKKAFGFAFVISCIFLTIFYYDKAILDYNLGIEARDTLFVGEYWSSNNEISDLIVIYFIGKPNYLYL